MKNVTLDRARPLSTVLITGAAKRIGAAIAIGLAREGYRIALHYHKSKSSASKLTRKINDEGGRCEIFQANLLDEKQAATLIKTVHTAFPDLNVLINNASIFTPDTLKTVNLQQFHQHMQIHVTAPLILTQTFASICKKGSIINMLDTQIRKQTSTHFSYLLSKKSLRDLTGMSALALAPYVRVNAIAPGLILPPVGKNKGYLDRRAQNIPLKRRGDPENILQSIAFLMTNPYITGEVLTIDGGETL